MRINHNIAALNTYRQFGAANKAQSASMEKLSSGLRINKAGDDAAGLAISEKMRGQIRGLDQASANAQDGISLIQTAEGALSETHSILQRMRELAVQSSNDTNTIDDRNEIQKEMEQLKSEVTRISTDTEFNTKKLLSGGIGATATLGTNAAKFDKVTVTDPKLDTGTYNVIVTQDTALAVGSVTDAGTGIATGTVATAAAGVGHTFGNFQVNVSDDAENAGQKTLELVDLDSGEVLATKNNQVDTAGSTYTIGGFTFDGGAAALENGSFTFTADADFTFELQDSGGNTLSTQSFTDMTSGSVNVNGLEIEFEADLAAGTTAVNVVNNSVQFHIGANENQTTSLAVNDMSAEALGIADVDVTSTTGAEDAITTINDAIKSVSAERSKLGAVQNRLDHTINNLSTSSENLTAAESRIRDVDYALAA